MVRKLWNRRTARRATENAGAAARRSFRPSLVRLEDRWVPSTSIPLNGLNWSALGPAPIVNGTGGANSGRVTAVAVHPTDGNTIYVGTAGGGVWKTSNGGASWSPLTDNQATLVTGSLTIDKTNPNTIYAGTGEGNGTADSFYGRGILKSTDAGATWALLTNGGQFDRQTVTRIIVSPTNPNLLYAAVGGPAVNTAGGKSGIWRSLDGGQNWTNITATGISGNSVNQPFFDLEMVPGSPDTLYCVVGPGASGSGAAVNGLYKTTNASAANPTWTLVTTLPSGSIVGRGEVAVTPADPNVVYVSFANPTTGGLLGLFQSTDGGQGWTNLFGTTNLTNYLGTQGAFDQTLAIDPANANVVYAGGQASLLRSTDAGANWTDLAALSPPPHAGHHATVFDAGGRLLDGDDGGLFRYDPAANAWQNLNGAASGPTASSALNTVQFVGIALHPTNPDVVYGGAAGNGTDKFTDALGWAQLRGGDGGTVRVDPVNPSLVYHTFAYSNNSSNPSFFERSTDGGATWQPSTTGINTTDPASPFVPFIIDPGNHNRLLLGTNKIYQSLDNGATWSQLGSTTFSAPVTAIGIGPAGSGIIYVSTGNQVYVSTDSGGFWNFRTPTGANGTFTDFAIDPTNSNTAYVVQNGFGGPRIWRTTTAGIVWNDLSGTGGSALPAVPAWSVVIDPGTAAGAFDDVLYVGTDAGVYRCTNPDSAVWFRYGAGLPNVQVRDLEFNQALGILAAGTYGRGVWEILATPASAAIFRGLGDLPGGDFYSTANAASTDGSVVVGASKITTGITTGFEAFRFTASTGMVGLGFLNGGVANSTAAGVSADGSVVVGTSSSTSGDQAFRFTLTGGMVGLGDLAGGNFFSQARGVSADGSVVVGMSQSGSGQEAFRWSGGNMAGLGDLSGGTFQSTANAASADGSVVVGSGTSDAGNEAFRWTSSGGMFGLGDLIGGAFYSEATGVSADGSVVVGYGNSASGFEAFRWTAAGGMVGLGDLPGGTFQSFATGVSADGSVVVGYGNTDAGTEAFRWTPGGGMRSVRDILVNDYGLGAQLAGWTLSRAFGVSADGRVIVGLGTDPSGLNEAWMARLDPPPRAVSNAPAGNVLGPVSAVDVVFNTPMDATTFSVADDISAFTGPAGDLRSQITGASWTSPTTLHITFAPQSTAGAYSLVLGPQIKSTIGLPMDQNGNGVLGEVPGDRYAATFNVSAAGPINLPFGFASGTAGVLVTNGSASITNGRLRLTTSGGGANQAGSVFSAIAQPIAQFSTTFTFQLTNADADGFTFTVQNVGPNAVGPTGAGLGYGAANPGDPGGLARSLAVKFDLFDNAGEGPNSTGVYTNGASPTVPADPLDPAIDLHSGHVMRATITYDGFSLSLALTDTATNRTFTKTYSGYNLPALVGGPNAFVGFTGATSSPSATQEILGWTYSVQPRTAYVDASWTSTPFGSDPDGTGPATSFGYDAFNTVQDAVNAAGMGGTVNLLNGSFPENVTLSATGLTLQGPAAGGAVTINPPTGDAVTITAGAVTLTGNGRLTVAGNSALGRNGVVVGAAGATLQGLAVTGFAGAGSAGVNVSGAGASARLVSDTVSGNAVGVRVVGGAALLQGNTLANNNAQGAGSAGLSVQSGGRVDAGGGDGAGMRGSSTGGNTFSGYAPGGALAIVNLNSFQTAPDATGPVGTAAGTVAAQNNTFTGAANYAQVEGLIFHRTDSPFLAYVDYRGASGGSGALAAPGVVAGSFRYVAAGTDRNDSLAAVQRSMIQGVSFQINAPVALNAGQALTDLLAIVRESPASTPGYAAGSLPANNTALALSAIDLTSSSLAIDGATGLTTVTLRFRNTGVYAGGGSAAMTEFGSLIDGIYRANVNGSSASLLFAGSGTAAANAQQRFHRLFGDVDNSGELDAADFSAFRNYLSSPASPFKPYLDFNLSGGSDTADTNAFNARLGSSLIE